MNEKVKEDIIPPRLQEVRDAVQPLNNKAPRKDKVAAEILRDGHFGRKHYNITMKLANELRENDKKKKNRQLDETKN